MRILLISTVGLAVLALAGAASGDAAPPQEIPLLQRMVLPVTGNGAVEVIPDTARVTASVITDAKTAKEARDLNAEIGQKAMAGIKALKLTDVTIKTLNYTMERVTRDVRVNATADLSQLNIPWQIGDIEAARFELHYPVLLGYRASNELSVEVKTDDADALSEAAAGVVDALMLAGGNKITGVAFALSKDPNEPMRQALAKAVRDARLTAEAFADAAGLRIMGIRGMSHTYRYPTPGTLAGVSAEAADSAKAVIATAMSAGTLQVTAQVSIQYELD